MISALLSQFAPYLIGIAAFVVASFAAYMKGRREGSSAAKAQQAEAEAKAIKTARKVEDDVRKSSDPDINSRLDKWMRDKR